MKNNLPEEIKVGYAAGTLPEAFDLVVATQMSLNDETRSEIEAYEAIGGAMLDEVEPEAMGDNALAQCMNRIDTNSPITLKRDSGNYVFPKPLRQIVGGDLDAVKWKSIGGGVKQCILKTEGNASVRLLSIPGGAKVPEHGHHGMELTLVLQGAFYDGDVRFGRGDLEVADEDMDHQPYAEVGETCICIAACDEKLKFHSFIPRMLQPLFKI